MTCKDCHKYSECSCKNKSIEDNWAGWCDEFVPIHKGIVIEKDGYLIAQSGYNWHTHIYDPDGKLVFHAQTSKEMNKEELEEYLRRFLIDLPKLKELAEDWSGEE